MEKQVYGIHGLRIVRNTWSYYTRKKKRRGITWDSDASHFLQWRREVRSQDNLILFHYVSSYPHCIPTQFAGSKTMFPYNSHPQKIRKVWFIPVLVGCFHFYLCFLRIIYLTNHPTLDVDLIRTWGRSWCRWYGSRYQSDSFLRAHAKTWALSLIRCMIIGL